ncbi:MAG: 16S rRNA (cytidine(1402)-2'-O)-methyltransferase [Parcubacteria group bacterium CG11_big_fil_rev_8_21_14_0_20_39_14]|nr:MAG: 16S rRNA (cytidine(1402)-2'-O)-methyltransferase [Parcubacteria group bacterium CG11_big_fil_rev_8_21_14_0_20_39_14]PIS35307.1 MAG: 16S rRNA (cytidine(1402)-2'-O)-methyltransferase [Parcubacteria group bacterium CG08_land_8_20_14_0_20_38_56]
MSVLYIVATPIGNLEDISKRALRILSEVDLILCEDTRQTQKLLNFYKIKTPTLSYHQHSKLKKVDYILDLLSQGKNLALVSDAGTPGISDPGSKLINLAMEQFNNITIISIPGSSALTAAASVCGFPMDKFLFLGFPPQKRKRKKFFEKVLRAEYPVIFYESPYRIMKTLRELNLTIKQFNNITISIVVCRELTKKFETIYRGTIEEVIGRLEKEKIRGEFAVIVNPVDLPR